ncbi:MULTISPECIES: hypothetical protein [Paenibacillus]|uniref:Uncharacterized protein n=1 Tax=Paenibacillus pasadenensis TaxID=217090 RepID=A0A2N5N3H3_9BACL|nr:MULTISPECIES: hypothetical protein [Paenibacillus]PLT44852.1 hypothetical protein B8V81_3283 [Paenibacillus pasadenensis]
MMNTDSRIVSSVPADPPVPRRASKRSPWPFLIAWIVIIAAGVAGAWFYTQRLQQELAVQIQQQTDRQIAEMQSGYDARLQQLESGYASQLAELQGKVDSLNELLAFNRDNASSKTDNSNKLYTQLSQVQKQLDELKKNLDVLK